MNKVIFDIMRHGEKDGDALTQKGVQQVRDSAQNNLAGCFYDFAFFSGLNRARQTVEICRQIVGEVMMGMTEEPGFSYEPAMTEAERWMGRPFSELKQEYEGKNVEWWLRNWAPTIWLRGQILATMRLLAQQHASWGYDTLQVLVGSHSPTAESGCLDPANTPALREADIIRYTWEVDPDEKMLPRLVESIVLRAPY